MSSVGEAVAPGQLGLGDRTDRGYNEGEMGNNLPRVDLGAGRTAKALVAGGYNTCAILDDNTVKCWGWNDSGQLGLGDKANRGDNPGEMGDNLPRVKLGKGRTAKALAAGGYHTCAILDDNTVKCWGEGGKLGLGDSMSRGLDASQMGDNLPRVKLGTGRTAKALAAGGNHTCAVLDDNTVKCWGWNYDGNLGLGDSSHRGVNPGEMSNYLPAVDLGFDESAR